VNSVDVMAVLGPVTGGEGERMIQSSHMAICCYYWTMQRMPV